MITKFKLYEKNSYIPNIIISIYNFLKKIYNDASYDYNSISFNDNISLIYIVQKGDSIKIYFDHLSENIKLFMCDKFTEYDINFSLMNYLEIKITSMKKVIVIFEILTREDFEFFVNAKKYNL